MVPGGRPGGYPPARLYVSHSAVDFCETRTVLSPRLSTRLHLATVFGKCLIKRYLPYTFFLKH